jgi:hypothetical protein
MLLLRKYPMLECLSVLLVNLDDKLTDLFLEKSPEQSRTRLEFSLLTNYILDKECSLIILYALPEDAEARDMESEIHLDAQELEALLNPMLADAYLLMLPLAMFILNFNLI